MDCLRYICQELPYEYLDIKRMSYENYMQFFDKQRNEEKIKESLSINEMVNIINTIMRNLEKMEIMIVYMQRLELAWAILH